MEPACPPLPKGSPCSISKYYRTLEPYMQPDPYHIIVNTRQWGRGCVDVYARKNEAEGTKLTTTPARFVARNAVIASSQRWERCGELNRPAAGPNGDGEGPCGTHPAGVCHIPNGEHHRGNRECDGRARAGPEVDSVEATEYLRRLGRRARKVQVHLRHLSSSDVTRVLEGELDSHDATVHPCQCGNAVATGGETVGPVGRSSANERLD